VATEDLAKALQPALNRLKEATKHWATAASSYHDPENFRIALNACIQAIRNVTFGLQSQKSGIRNFERWYSGWQNALRNDFLMKWCVEARNRIVKQSDLETHSIAMASLVTGYRAPPVNVLRVSPFASSRDIAIRLQRDLLPPPLNAYGYLYVERRWVAADLVNFEVLETLAYALYVLRAILLDVVEQRGPTALYGKAGPPSPDTFEDGAIDERYLPDFVSSFREYRSAWLELSSSQFVRPGYEQLKPAPDEGPRAEARYKLSELKLGKEQKKGDLKDRVNFFLTIGKRLLEVDGYHIPHVFLIDRKNRLTTISPQFATYSEKPLLWAEIAKQAKKEQATTVIAVLEAWSAPFDPAFPTRRPEYSPNRMEVLHAAGFTFRGDGYAVTVPFFRKDGKITFGPESVTDVDRIGFLEPFRRVWRKTIRRTKANPRMEPMR
jgi:hypothetical protein